MEKSGCIKAVFKLLHFINQQIGYKFMRGYMTQVQFKSIPFIDQSLDNKLLFLFEVKKVIVATSRFMLRLYYSKNTNQMSNALKKDSQR